MNHLNILKPIYYPSECNLDEELFLPIAKNSSTLDCMVGYFTSGSLRELSSSIVSYLLSPIRSTIKFIISPNLTDVDINALKEAISLDKNLIPFLFPDFEINKENLRNNTIKALCYLIATERLEIKIALKDNGLFHTKCWLFRTEQGDVAVHGSGNATSSGLTKNFEQLVVSRAWKNDEADYICKDLRNRFESIWSDRYCGITVRSLNHQTLSYIQSIKEQTKFKGFTDDEVTERIVESLQQKKNNAYSNKGLKLRMPEGLNCYSGSYKHQGEAIDAWMAKGKGILSIATGGGKTLTSLVAATLVSANEEKLMLVITVPTKALLNQWAADVERFNITPYNTYGRSVTDSKVTLKRQLRNLRNGVSKNEVIIITHEGMKSALIPILEEASDEIPTMLIGDEVHNLGSIGFQANAPRFFKYKLGLSATYERQFDVEGTDFLLKYFGEVVYDFPLDKAIGTCLVPYEYYVHRVEFEEDEQEEWFNITNSIRKLSYAMELPDGNADKEKFKLLCLKRRRLVESANGKILKCAAILPAKKSELSRTLFFCTDKDPSQLNSINSLLSKRSITFHQVTAEETGSPKILANVIEAFNRGEHQALTSKRVLDEGFNIPQTETAYFLASNTVRRQWIQRLGRVLRQSQDTGKEKATVHDFVVIPKVESGQFDADLRSLLKGEFDRISYFSKLSLNGLERDGSLNLMSELLEIMGERT